MQQDAAAKGWDTSYEWKIILLLSLTFGLVGLDRFILPVLLGIALALGEPFWPTDWRPLLGLFVSSQLIGQGCLVYALKHFSPLVIGIALLTQPAVAALAGWISFGEVLSAVDLLGIALVGSALVLAKVAQPSTPGERDDSGVAGGANA